MCTVIVDFNPTRERCPIVVATNRDELLGRSAEDPRIWPGRPTMLAPVDLQRQGTWIGVNEHGVFAALTNRVDVASVWDPKDPEKMRSRGQLVRIALQHRTAADAIAAVASLPARAYNGYNLVIVDAHEAFIVRGGGIEGAEHPSIERQSDKPGLLIVTNLGIGPKHSPRAEAIMALWERDREILLSEAPHRATWNQLLTIHDPDPHHDSCWMKRMASTCIHRPAEENYGTRSSAFITLSPKWGAYGAEWRYWHRDGHACSGPWDRVRTLPIVG